MTCDRDPSLRKTQLLDGHHGELLAFVFRDDDGIGGAFH